jgi:hypothetical protein
MKVARFVGRARQTDRHGRGPSKTTKEMENERMVSKATVVFKVTVAVM